MVTIGRPNVGKFIADEPSYRDRRSPSHRNKPDNQKQDTDCVHTCDEGQIVFLDTPGIHKAKTSLENTWYRKQERPRSRSRCHYVVGGAVHIRRCGRAPHCRAAAEGWSSGDSSSNKIDTVKRRSFPAIDTYRKICDFAEKLAPCLPAAEKHTQDIIQVFSNIFRTDRCSMMRAVTDQPQCQIAAEIIREKAPACTGWGDPLPESLLPSTGWRNVREEATS